MAALNFFQFPCELVAKVPRVKTPDGQVRTVEVPWARPGSGFTLLFEALALLLATEMSMSAAAEYLDEHDTRLWRAVGHHVAAAHAKENWGPVCSVAIDETSAKRGHRYVTVFMDAARRRVLLVAEGKGKEAIAAFAQALHEHGGDPAQIEHVVMDMSAAFQAGVKECFPNARIVFELFHIMLHAGEAVDQTRREVLEAGAVLPKGALWTLRGNEWNQSDEQSALRRAPMKEHRKLGRAVSLRSVLHDIFKTKGPQEAEGELKWWCGWAQRSRLAVPTEMIIARPPRRG